MSKVFTPKHPTTRMTQQQAHLLLLNSGIKFDPVGCLDFDDLYYDFWDHRDVDRFIVFNEVDRMKYIADTPDPTRPNWDCNKFSAAFMGDAAKAGMDCGNIRLKVAGTGLGLHKCNITIERDWRGDMRPRIMEPQIDLKNYRPTDVTIYGGCF
jgi:hypothetical protein